VDSPITLVVVLAEERLDGIVQRVERQIFVLEPGQRPAAACSDARKPIGGREKLFSGDALVCAEAIKGIAWTRPKQLERAHDRAGQVI
jgi:hypothetical protein